MKTATKTHIGQVRQHHAEAKQSIAELLGWSEQEYCNFQFAEYCKFADTLYEGWDAAREQLMYSPVFRGFWLNQWHMRDALILEESTSRSYLSEEFRRIHFERKYMLINDHRTLMDDDDFMESYGHLLTIIR
ncbi:hypothetical protein [Peijinzhouia sedimentorum]